MLCPSRSTAPFTLGPDGAPASNASTDDGQAIVGVDKGSVPARPPDTSVTVRILPVDAGTLGPLPPGLRAVSNAYKVGLSYLPSGTPLTTLPVKGTIALTAAEVGTRTLYSADGQAWEERQSSPYGQDQGLFTDFDMVGWFVVATSATPGGSTGGTDGLRLAMLIIAGVVPIAGAALALRLPSPVPMAPPPKKRTKPRR